MGPIGLASIRRHCTRQSACNRRAGYLPRTLVGIASTEEGPREETTMMVEQERKVLASIENSVDRALELAGELVEVNRRLHEQTQSLLKVLRSLVEQQAVNAGFEWKALKAIEATENELKELFPPWRGTK